MKKFGLNNNQLKIIAMLSMLVDHIGVQLFPDLQILRMIGRLALPIFAYMIAEGCLHTRNRVKYLSLIAILATLCQIVYFIADGTLYLGILVVFSLSISLIFSIDGFLKKKNAVSFLIMLLTVGSVAFVVYACPKLLYSYWFDVDYGIYGILLPVVIYFAKKKWLKIIAAAVVLAALASTMPTYQWYAFAALPLLCLYNGQRGKANLKYLFYIFYPTHLAVIYLIDMIL